MLRSLWSDFSGIVAGTIGPGSQSTILAPLGEFMLVRRLYSFVVFIFPIALASGIAHAQTYPNEVIRIVTCNPGGSYDLAARLLAQGLTGPLGQPVTVDNRGGGMVPIEVAAKSAPDGYTLLVAKVYKKSARFVGQ